ncbi:MAG: hypothetical protein IPM46_13760 [Flavobacteriales bacterium]|nr:hypothetical protein [Flavobacteriales bacterium]
MSAATAAGITTMLQRAVNEGTGTVLRSRYGLNGPYAGKTGTSQDYSDAWFVAYTPGLVIGTWVGAHDPSVHFGSSLGTGACSGPSRATPSGASDTSAASAGWRSILLTWTARRCASPTCCSAYSSDMISSKRRAQKGNGSPGCSSGSSRRRRVDRLRSEQPLTDALAPSHEAPLQRGRSSCAGRPRHAEEETKDAIAEVAEGRRASGTDRPTRRAPHVCPAR